jgi:hypothetical protein
MHEYRIQSICLRTITVKAHNADQPYKFAARVSITVATSGSIDIIFE